MPTIDEPPGKVAGQGPAAASSLTTLVAASVGSAVAGVVLGAVLHMRLSKRRAAPALALDASTNPKFEAAA